MCGIAGLISPQGLQSNWRQDLQAMSDLIVHRGPDDHGYFYEGLDTGKPVHDIQTPGGKSQPKAAFGHRRLSILDLSPKGRQPFVRGEGRVFLTYNGEIYNYLELKKELEARGARFQTESDTEILIEAYLAWGIDCVKRFRGIFAFGLADFKTGRAYLVRDQLGVKPLYYGKVGQTWAFSSEMKAFLGIEGFKSEVDPEAIRKYLHFLWIPGEHSGLQGVKKLGAGTILEINLERGDVRETKYWSAFDVVAGATQSAGSLDATLESLRSELQRSVSEEMMSDVPLGAFLSGGLDSSLVVALMKKSRQSQGRVSTYAVGYSKSDLAYDIVPDDLPYARQVAQRLDVDNTEILLSPKVSDLLPKIVWTLDEPNGDPAAISSHLICEAAKKRLTVMLSGMGGDELFAGYPRQRALVYGMIYRKSPQWARQVFSLGVDRLPGAGKTFQAKVGRAAKKFLSAAESDPLTHYIAMETYFSEAQQLQMLDPEGALARVDNPVIGEYDALKRQILAVENEDPVKQAILLDLLTYLPYLNLSYTDRTSMANGVEVRVPLLDLKLVEWALKRPVNELMRWRKGKLEGKWLLKKAAEPYLPPEVIWRKKAGFGAPVRSWLRNDLQDMRAELLGPKGLASRGWVKASEIARLEKEFLTGQQDHALRLWMLMSLELWARQYVDRRKS